MKKIFSLTVLLLFVCSYLFAQVPQAINYQGVARDNSGNVIANHLVALKLSILSGSALGNVVYIETHIKTTDGFGLFNLQIGQGTVVLGVFSTINWGNNSYFLKVEIDSTGGTDYQLAGVSQFASVPYSLVAENVINNDAINNEINARIAADASLTTILSAETARAHAAEITLSTNLATETSARNQGDLDILAAAETYTDAGIAAESVARANADATLTTSLSAESSRAHAAETVLSTNLTTETNRAVGIENGLRNDLTAESNARIQGDLDAVSASKMYTDAQINNESNRAISSEVALTSNIIAESNRAQVAENTLSTNLATETSARIAADANTWSINGNIGTNGNNFIGTTNPQDLVFKTNSTEYMRILSSGNIGIGTPNPTAKLEINGTVKITDGSQGANKVLTSDNNGNASWQTPSGGTGSLPNGTYAGQMLYWNGNAWVPIAPGTNGQTLTYCNGVPTWGTCPNLPTIITTPMSSVQVTTATCGGNITSDGGQNIIARGVCWSTSHNPNIDLCPKTNDGTGSGTFTSTIAGLTGGTIYYVKAYATTVLSGTTYGNEVTFTTQWACGTSITVTHTAGSVAPVTKTVTYNTVTMSDGTTTKCWITSNLGADHEATTYSDNTELAAGWYWQFDQLQGFKHDGTNRTPATTWINPLPPTDTWDAVNDPCTILLGNGWRIPTQIEWYNVKTSNSWTGSAGTFSSDLKLHNAGSLSNTTGNLSNRGGTGCYWSSTQKDDNYSYLLLIGLYSANAGYTLARGTGCSIRCLRDY